ncbi:unnamed protein product, partial [Ceratitis capitata]
EFWRRVHCYFRLPPSSREESFSVGMGRVCMQADHANATRHSTPLHSTEQHTTLCRIAV